MRQRALVQNDLALACIEGGKHDDAVTLLNQAIEAETRLHASGQSANGVDYRFFINRGDCFQALGRLEHAIADFHRAYDANPADWAIKTRLAMIHHAMGAQLFNNGEFHAAEIELDRDPVQRPRRRLLRRARPRSSTSTSSTPRTPTTAPRSRSTRRSTTCARSSNSLSRCRRPRAAAAAARRARRRRARRRRAAAAAPAAPSRSMTRTGFPPLTSLRTVAPELARASRREAKANKAQRAIAR